MGEQFKLEQNSVPKRTSGWGQDGGPLRVEVLRGGLGAAVALFVQLLLVALTGLLEYSTRHLLSLALLYQVPIAVATWRAGFAGGVMVALAATGTWHVVDMVSGEAGHPAIWLWNGLVRFGVFIITASLLSRLRSSLVQEKVLARTDQLTGAANGRTFYEAVWLAVEQSLRAGRPLTLAYLDLDNFKQVNDRCGHFVGDRLLRQITDVVRRNIRPGDMLARLGGDEFALLLPETGGDEARTILTRLHQLLFQTMTDDSWPVTVSIGAATFVEPSRDIDLMVRRTDLLMYQAKNGGKNRVEHEVVAQPSTGFTGSRLERRAVARILCTRWAHVRAERSDGTMDLLARIRDISRTGIGVRLQCGLPLQSLVTVEPVLGGAKVLLARVMWSRQDKDSWLHGCELAAPLSVEEVNQWVGQIDSEMNEPATLGNTVEERRPLERV